MTDRPQPLDYVSPLAPVRRPQGEILAMVAVAAAVKASVWFLAGLFLVKLYGAGTTGADFAAVGGIVSIAVSITLAVTAMLLQYQRIYLFIAVMALCVAFLLSIGLLSASFGGP